MNINCMQRTNTVQFDYEPFSFNPLDIVEMVDRSSAETAHTLITLNTGTKHLVNLFHDELKNVIRFAKK